MKRKLLALAIIFSFALTGLSSCAIGTSKHRTGGFPYDAIVRDGYTGSEEEWVASLVGEEMSPYAEEKSAYALAKEKGYSGSIGNWTETIAGAKSSDADKTVYAVACANGYNGTLAEWLNDLCEFPEELGKSENGQSKTSYEYACEYGYEGPFIEWMISLISGEEN